MAGNTGMDGQKLGEIEERLNSASGDELSVLLELLASDPRKGARDLAEKFRKRQRKEEAEGKRLEKLWEKERALQLAGYANIAGIDEAGRGPLAGPVVAAAVILPCSLQLTGLNDSKKVSPQKRRGLAEEIKNNAVTWGIGVVSNLEIDSINIYRATVKAMVQAVGKLSGKPDFLLIDAMKIPLKIVQESIVHGDSVCASIAAASILAKTYRDALMEMMDVLYPGYGFKEHQGYGTPRHLAALRELGPCPIHRRSFIQNYMEMGENGWIKEKPGKGQRSLLSNT